MSDDPSIATLPAEPTGDGPSPLEDPGAPVEVEVEGPGEIEGADGGIAQREDDQAGAVEEPSEEEILVPKTLPVERKLVDKKGREATYIQAPLLYFQKLELYGILGEAVQVVMEGDQGLGLDELMGIADPRNMLAQFTKSMPGAEDAPDADENEDSMMEAGKMLAAFSKVVALAPMLVKRAYLVALDVPSAHRKWAMDWGLVTLNDDDGLDIMHTFLDQNWGVMEDFFVHELPKLAKRATQARKRHKSATGPSKR